MNCVFMIKCELSSDDGEQCESSYFVEAKTLEKAILKLKKIKSEYDIDLIETERLGELL